MSAAENVAPARKDEGMLLAVALRVLRHEITEDQAVQILKDRGG